MKLTVLFLIVSLFQLQANESYAQKARVSMDLNEVSLEKVLDEIESLTEFKFLYDYEHVNYKKIVSIKADNERLSSILDRLFESSSVSYKVVKKQIILKLKKNKSEKEKILDYKVPLKLDQQKIEIKGTIKDLNGQPLPGANILEKGTTNGAQADFDGNFSLQVEDPNTTLVVSYLGFQIVEVPLNGKVQIAVSLKEQAAGLDEIVIVGYGQVKKSDLTGAVGSIKAEEIEKQRAPRIDQALQGRVSGVQVVSSGGAPGSGTSIRIRGGNSINSSNEPLFVIDGFIGGGDLNTINPQDIESIEILKDASATAIYGSRGANGVVLITTKRGKGESKAVIRYNAYYGVQQPVKKLDLLNGPEFVAFQNEFFAYSTGNTNPEDAPFPPSETFANTDWQDILFNSGSVNEHNLSIAKASEDSNYFFSMNYFTNQGTQLGTSFDRYQFRLNFDQKIGQSFRMGASISGVRTLRENPKAGGLSLYPTAPIYNDDGTFFRINQTHGSAFNNPIAANENILSETTLNRAFGNIYAQLQPAKGLILKSTFGFDISSTKLNIYQSTELPTRAFFDNGGFARVVTGFPITIQNENTIDYNISVGDHTMGLLGGFTYQNFKREDLEGRADEFFNDSNLYHDLEAGNPALREVFSSESEWTLLSGFFRANYSYKSRYLFTVSGRWDGSSRLVEGKKWQFFPSAALAWRLSEEPFIKDLDVFSNLKLRMSYGQTGNQSISPYATLARLQSGTTLIGGQEVNTVIQGLAANENLSWETTSQFDFGLESGLFKNRLNIEFDYYKKTTEDLLLNATLARQTGFEDQLTNIGSIENKGFDVTITARAIKTDNFKWETSITLGKNNNKVLALADKDTIQNGVGTALIIGKPVGTFFGAKYLGVYQADDPDLGSNLPGSPKWEDLNEDGSISALDAQIIGDPNPDFYGGWNNTFTYKRLTLNLFFDFSVGNDIYDLSGRNFNTGFNTNVYGRNRNRWTESNTGSNIPRAGSMEDSYFSSYPGFTGNSYDVYDGSFLRLKTLNLEYKIPVEKIGVFDELSVYTNISNLFTLTSYEGFTPDVNSEDAKQNGGRTRRGFDQTVYPQSRTILFGINAKF
ncbi:TonB-dependent receptor [uncultured Wocania sp.]|uniref:SusC/RagA family TonB-linked outer membrane protein n=1 Tax=uncultured Wocania sp. TaxID=2834404 RepID=UPI0030FA37DB